MPVRMLVFVALAGFTPVVATASPYTKPEQHAKMTSSMGTIARANERLSGVPATPQWVRETANYVYKGGPVTMHTVEIGRPWSRKSVSPAEAVNRLTRGKPVILRSVSHNVSNGIVWGAGVHVPFPGSEHMQTDLVSVGTPVTVRSPAEFADWMTHEGDKHLANNTDQKPGPAPTL